MDPEYAVRPLERVRRSSTHMSEVSRIISGIRDDLDQDQQERESYKNIPCPEEAAVEEFGRMATDEDAHDHPVDGKFAFLQALLVMLMIFLTWGANAAFGVYLNYYIRLDYFHGATKYDFALMGGVVVCLAQGLGPIGVLMLRVFGLFATFAVGIVLQTLAYFLASACEKFWQLFLCQGVLVGISFSLIFIPGTIVLPTWFEKRMATAMGIAVGGLGLGGVVFSLSLNKIIAQTGNQKWALRATGFITLAGSLVGLCFIRFRNHRRLEFDYARTLKRAYIAENVRIVFDPRVFDNYPMLVTGVWFGVCSMAYVIVLYSFLLYATSVGLSNTQALNLLAVLNAAQVVGRPLVGNLGDYFGRNNTAALVCVYLALMILAFWLHVSLYGALMALAVFLGGPVGLGNIMTQAMAADILRAQGRIDKLPAGWLGLNIVVALFSLPAEVIPLKLNQPHAKNPYRHALVFTGCLFLLGFLLLLVNREWLVRKKLQARRLEAMDIETDKENAEMVTERIRHCSVLLRRTPAMFVARIFYPVRV